MEDNPAVTGEFTGRYTIERELGRGGAAIVYLAHDSRQERHVALKVLHKELAQAIGAKRFLREIKHSSSLQHPHLLTILDSGESRGTLYYVMPYMADGSLRTRIAKEKQLPVGEAIAITRDVGEALAYAHSRGIVHRDIKPDNVLFSGNHACLADFGIARAVDSVAADTLTSTGLVVGTPAYMSPEQASGEKTVDARSDQYSLACLLYEMITGLPPFIGATQQSVISQRFSQPPPSMRVHRPTVPEHVERAVQRAMAVVPADRFASVTDFVAALHEPGAVAAPVSAHAIRRRWFAVGAAAALVVLAVMAAGPGGNWMRGALGPRPDTTRFVVLPFASEAEAGTGDQVAAGMYSALSKWNGLTLERDIAVRDAVAARGEPPTTERDALAIARRLGAGRLIWGRVTADGGRVRIYADLYDVATGTSLVERSATVDTAFTESALRDLANALVGGPMPLGHDTGVEGTESFPAWRAYARGAASLASWQLEAAERELTVAVREDPQFGIAQLRLAQVLSWTRPESDRSWSGNAARAVALRGELSARDAKLAEALHAFGRREYAVACERYRELVQGDTTDATAWFGLGGCLRFDDIVLPDARSRSRWRFRSSWHSAGEAFRRALEIDPRIHAIPRFDWIKAVFAVEPNLIRTGRRPGGRIAFAGFPRLVVERGSPDTIAYTPYPFPDFDTERDSASLARRSEALARNSEVLLHMVISWTQAYPQSSQAFRALGWLRENRGELTGSSPQSGASGAYRRARELAKTPADVRSLGEDEVRVLVKLGRYSAASELADSVRRFFGEPTLATWKSVAGLAGLTGRVSGFAGALEYYWADFADVRGLDQAVSAAAANLLAGSVLGLCGPPLTAAENDLRQLIESRVQPSRHPEIRGKVVGLALTYLVACSGGMSMANATRNESLITRAQIAYARGDSEVLRPLLDTLAANRASVRPGDLMVNLSFREALLRMHAGDTASAARILDNTLSASPTLAPSFLEHPLESAMLVRAMVVRADLAAARGEKNVARKWATAVTELWAKADPPLQPVVRRMQAIARSNP